MADGTATEELPRLVLVVGVAGSGKTTVGRLLAERLGWAFRDGDEFHSEADRAKMAAGHPLTDGDRRPWLEAIREWMDEAIAGRRQAVVTCSALKRAYRDTLLAGRPEVLLVYLHGSREVLGSRLASRHGHFFPAGLLESQLAELQAPTPDERPLVVEIDQPPEAVVTAVLSLMGRESASGRQPAGSDAEQAVRAVARTGASAPFGPTGESWRLVRGAQSAVVVQLGGALR
ncbi:gluconokinase, partial [Streptomyces gardneri]|uniref:gluconokinase n=1 Tax=Streptomyces gardneri TaxID=66892 RepID=UPI00369763B0